MKVRLKYLSINIQRHYNLQSVTTADDFIYVKIQKGMYGLKNTAIITYDNLKQQLHTFGYQSVEGTVGIWRHETRWTRFCVCENDFGIKYYTKSDAMHLLNVIRSHYKYTVDWYGRNYCGLSLTWQFDKGIVDESIPASITKALKQLNHSPPTTPQFSPHHKAPFQYYCTTDEPSSTPFCLHGMA